MSNYKIVENKTYTLDDYVLPHLVTVRDMGFNIEMAKAALQDVALKELALPEGVGRPPPGETRCNYSKKCQKKGKRMNQQQMWILKEAQELLIDENWCNKFTNNKFTLENYGLSNNWFSTKLSSEKSLGSYCNDTNNTESSNSKLLKTLLKQLEDHKAKVSLLTSATTNRILIRNKKQEELELAQKQWQQTVTDVEDAEKIEQEFLTIFHKLQNDVEHLSLVVKRENIANKKKLIQSVYDAQMSEIAEEELAMSV